MSIRLYSTSVVSVVSVVLGRTCSVSVLAWAFCSGFINVGKFVSKVFFFLNVTYDLYE